MSLPPEVEQIVKDEVRRILSPHRAEESFRERLSYRVREDRKILDRLSTPPCSCPGALWDSIFPPPPVCGRHGV